jgi:uncharacterized metal-binding protein YceD (DUF177 family)
MPARTDTFDLGRLRLQPGEGRRLELAVGFEPLRFGDADYTVDPADLVLDVSRMSNSGYSLRLRLETDVRGLCMRCLEEAVVHQRVDAREIDQPGGGDELTSPYVNDHDVLDVAAWARDALVLALPVQLACPETEACDERRRAMAERGGAATAIPEPSEPGIDPRWAKLSELKFD